MRWIRCAAFAIILGLAIWPARVLFANQIAANNLATVAEADAYAKKLAAEYQSDGQPLVILHVGNDVPRQLKWVLLHLDATKIPYEFKLVTQQAIEKQLQAAYDLNRSRNLILTYDKTVDPLVADDAIMTAWQQAKLMTRRFFGVPNGITLRVKINRDRKTRLAEMGVGVMNSLGVASSLEFSLYFVKQAGFIPHVPELGFLMGWIWLNAYHSRSINAFNGQGRAILEKKRGFFRAHDGYTLLNAVSAVQTFITNAAIVAASYGIENTFTQAELVTNLTNVGINMLAKNWVNHIINSHQATPDANGTGVIKPGQWKPRTTIVVNIAWNVGYGLIKNLHLLHIGSYGTWAYFVLGTVGTSKLLFDQRHWFARKWDRLLYALKGLRGKACESLLIFPLAVDKDLTLANSLLEERR